MTAKRSTRKRPLIWVQYRRELSLLLVASVLLLIGVLIIRPGNNAGTDFVDLDEGVSQLISNSLNQDLQHTRKALTDFEDTEAKRGVRVVAEATISGKLSTVATDIKDQNFPKAHRDLEALNASLASWRELLGQMSVTAGKDENTSLAVPILMYHKTPPDFENQLQFLATKGYTTIDPKDLVGALHHQTTLPKKPVIITFDDGFASQMQAFYLLRKHNMKATFYIIDGGENSNWCIGAGRHYHDLSQPKSGCGDAYLTWSQIRALDQSGLINIAAHTINHRNLASLTADQQRFEIAEGKSELETQLGHPVYDFAYPYGGFNATTIEEVQRAGFRSAVTTLPGIDQPADGQYTLHRVRSAYGLL